MREALGLAILGLIVLAGSLDARADRIFYRAATWLETSAEVQRLSLLGVLRGWERLAVEAERTAVAGGGPTHRQRAAARLTDCIGAEAHAVLVDVQARVTAFAAADPERIAYSLSDFIAAALAAVCASP